MAPSGPDPLIVVVHRRVKPGCEKDYERAVREFIAYAIGSPGHQGMQLREPEAGGRDYTVIAKFRSLADRRAFTSSAGYLAWMQRLRALTESDPEIAELSGLESWFTPSGQTYLAKPPKWKMAILTFASVYCVTVLIALTIGPFISVWPIFFRNAVVASIVVAALTWVVMPNLTRVLHTWLFARGNPEDVGAEATRDLNL